MNLAYRDIRHKLLRFVLTNFGLSLLLGIVIMIPGVYGGLVDDALRLARAANADLWVVEAGTNGPFAEGIAHPRRHAGIGAPRLRRRARRGGHLPDRSRPKSNGKPLRLFLVGFEPGRPGGPRKLMAGRDIMRSHYEMIVDRSAGLEARAGGAARHARARVHGRRPDARTRSPRPAIRSPISPCATRRRCSSNSRRRPSGARPRAEAAQQSSDQINAVIAKVSPYVPVNEVAAALSRWKHLTTLTQAQQETLLSKFVIEKARKQQLMIMVLLVIVSAVIIALIIYTLTMDKVRSIATLKFVGAPDRTIVGLIVQQALSMGIFGYFTGLALVLVFKPYFPRRLVLDPAERRGCVRHHRRDLPCRQHPRHPARA